MLEHIYISTCKLAGSHMGTSQAGTPSGRAPGRAPVACRPASPAGIQVQTVTEMSLLQEVLLS